MATLVSVFHNIVTLWICLLAGYLCRKQNLLSGETLSQLSSLLIFAFLPCTIVVSMQRPFSSDLLMECLLLLVISFGIFLFGTVMGYVMCKCLKIPQQDKGVYIFGLTFPNVVYMGMPVIYPIYGEDAIFYIAMANIAFNVLLFTLGLRLIVIGYERPLEKISVKNLLTNVPILATLIGLFLFFFSIRLPESINNGLSLLGNMTTPLSMLIVGSVLATCDLKKLFLSRHLYGFIFAKLLFIPVVIYWIIKHFIHNSTLLGVIVLISAMPVGALTAIFASRYRVNTELGTKMVCVSTLISMATIPLISMLI